ncbi:hypothetical protein PFICI_00205 [Pestalotiopsis fici W106-1]|uniref:Uncharacterized protein n=1 Tax=Pestalotiopsis fici (strain W106-1 / CGMCC3.15140) TaxID=1229662 RepID=W3XLN8_PESFW|nr:uncharacterized protein PFICI_00205 [Pestalotiopsis fici W106-1]ETS86377.1 hypothetical protein PFICI_00205 [Pestalotiopsis fici W106-1]
MHSSPFMNVPAEVRGLIYEYLFDDAGNDRLEIRNIEYPMLPKREDRVRTKYHLLDHSIVRRCYQATYHLKTKDAYFCASLMRVNRKIYEETSYIVYSRHSFDFGVDIEAVQPFFSDLTPGSRQLIQEVSLCKRGPLPIFENDRSEWRNLCRYLGESCVVKKLRLVVQGGRPNVDWTGPKEFSARDLQLLADLKHESLDWVSELAQVEIKELEVLPDLHYAPPPTTSHGLIFAAVSASIEKGLTEFLRSQLHLAPRVGF